MISGVYVIRCDPDSIKIGMSDNIERRLKQYTGYQGSARPVQRLMLVYTADYKDFEKVSHKFASDFGLPRHMPYEVFDCSLDQQAEFLEAFKAHLISRYEHRITNILTEFEEIRSTPAIIPAPISNIRGAVDGSAGALLAPITPVDTISTFANNLDQFKYKPTIRNKPAVTMRVYDKTNINTLRLQFSRLDLTDESDDFP